MSIDLTTPDFETTELYPGGSTTGGFKPVFSPDGKRIAFGCGRNAGTERLLRITTVITGLCQTSARSTP